MKRRIFCVGRVLLIILTLTGCNSAVTEQNPVSFENMHLSIENEKEEAPQLSIIGSYHEDMVQKIAELFEKKMNCHVTYTRMPTGDAEDCILSHEKDPEYQVWIGGTVDGHEVLKEKGLLVPYHSDVEEELPAQYLDKDDVWKAQYVEVLSIGVNMERWDQEFSEKVEHQPQTLEDLLNPAYRGEIVIPDPMTSGTGYTFLASVLGSMGEEEGWNYIEKLNEQIGQYTSSGYTAAEKTGLGQYLICVNFVSDQLLVKSLGYPVESCIYSQAGWTPVPVSLIKGAEDNELAREFVDFCLTKDACDVLVQSGQVLAVREDCITPEDIGKLKDLELYEAFQPVEAAKYKQNRTEQFSKLLP